MEEMGWKHLVGQLGVALVIFGFAVGFWLYDKRRKKKERTQNDVDKLKSSRVSFKHNSSLPWSEDLKVQIQKLGLLANSRRIKGTKGELICYLNERGKSQFKGFLNLHESDLPLRIILFNQNGNLALRLDEDWGFQMFVGPVQTAFKERYAELLQKIAKQIETDIQESV